MILTFLSWRNLLLANSEDFDLCLDWVYLIQCLVSVSSVDLHPRHCMQFIMLIHLRYRRFSQSTRLLMYLSLETLMSPIRNGWPFLLELIDRLNSAIISNDLPQMVNFPNRIPVILTVLRVWIYLFYFLILVFHSPLFLPKEIDFWKSSLCLGGGYTKLGEGFALKVRWVNIFTINFLTGKGIFELSKHHKFLVLSQT